GGGLRVLDFGLAKMSSKIGESVIETITESGQLLGTTKYMSPEQCQGKALDARSDVYSLGSILYETLCGMPPFDADTPIGIIMKNLKEYPKRLHSIVPTIPESAELIIFKAMQKEADLRYSTASEMEAELHTLLQHFSSKHVDTVAGLNISQELRSSLHQLDDLPRKKPSILPVLSGLLITFAIALFLLSDPGPGGLVVFLLQNNPDVKQRTAAFDKCGAFFMSNSRWRAAADMLEARLTLDKNMPELERASLLSKLALCCAEAGRKTKAREYACSALRICDSQQWKEYCFSKNTETVMRIFSVFQKAKLTWNDALWDELNKIREMYAVRANIELYTNVVLAMQAMSVSDYTVADYQVCFLFEALMLCEIQGYKQGILDLVKSREQQDFPYLEYTATLNDGLRKTKAKALKNELRKQTAEDVLALMIDVILNGPSVHKNDRSSAALILLEAVEAEVERGVARGALSCDSSGLQKVLTSDAVASEKAAFAALASRMQLDRGNYASAVALCQTASNEAAQVKSGDLSLFRAKQTFEFLAVIANDLPDQVKEKPDLALKIFSDAKASSHMNLGEYQFAKLFHALCAAPNEQYDKYVPAMEEMFDECRTRSNTGICFYNELLPCAVELERKGNIKGRDRFLHILQDDYADLPPSVLKSYDEYKQKNK
ncbi:MAG: protein kinase, partial [Candidatus Obscuribacterales bacterium]|nr:protein kinase [Candidatus Obscuribacterales bacterium]